MSEREWGPELVERVREWMLYRPAVTIADIMAEFDLDEREARAVLASLGIIWRPREEPDEPAGGGRR